MQQGSVGKSLGTIRGLKEYCTVHRDTILVHRLAPEAEVHAYWPGGEANPRKNLSAWIWCFARYCAFLDRDTETRKLVTSPSRQAVVRDALADEPETVTLAGANDDGSPKTVTVYPKSEVALVAIHKRNLWLATITEQAETIAACGDTAADLELLGRAYDEQSYLRRVIAWIACTNGVRLPFDRDAQRPTPPTEWDDLHAADFYAIAAAFQRVNMMRLAALDLTRKSDSRPDFTVFIASIAATLNTTTAGVLNDMSLAGALAAAAERGRGYEEAEKKAKQKAARNGRA